MQHQIILLELVVAIESLEDTLESFIPSQIEKNENFKNILKNHDNLHGQLTNKIVRLTNEVQMLEGRIMDMLLDFVTLITMLHAHWLLHTINPIQLNYILDPLQRTGVMLVLVNCV